MTGQMRGAIASAVLAAAAVSAGSGVAMAEPVNPNGWTADLQLAAPLPEGLFFIDTGTYFERSPVNNYPTIDAGVNLPVLVWSTPVTLLGGRLEAIATTPEVGVGVNPGGPGSLWLRAMYNPAGLVGMAWDLGGGFSVSDFVGGFIPVNTEIANIGNLGSPVGGVGGNFWTFIESANIAYNHDGWSLSANFFYGHSGNDVITGLYNQPDTGDVDFAATKHIGKWEIGLVGYASTDLNGANWNTDAFGGVHRQSQIALGGLVGYDFGPVIGQIYVTRDVAEDNYTGYDTRFWGRLIIPIWTAPKPAPALKAKY